MEGKLTGDIPCVLFAKRIKIVVAAAEVGGVGVAVGVGRERKE